jgi:hypothetical protein
MCAKAPPLLAATAGNPRISWSDAPLLAFSIISKMKFAGVCAGTISLIDTAAGVNPGAARLSSTSNICPIGWIPAIGSFA